MECLSIYHVLAESKGRTIVIRVEGRMTFQDYRTILPHLKNRIKQYGKIRIIVELKDSKGVEIRGALKALPYALRYGKHVEKKAIITDEAWIYSWVKFFSPFSTTKVRCFPTTKAEKAREWVRK